MGLADFLPVPRGAVCCPLRGAEKIQFFLAPRGDSTEERGEKNIFSAPPRRAVRSYKKGAEKIQVFYASRGRLIYVS